MPQWLSRYPLRDTHYDSIIGVSKNGLQTELHGKCPFLPLHLVEKVPKVLKTVGNPCRPEKATQAGVSTSAASNGKSDSKADRNSPSPLTLLS